MQGGRPPGTRIFVKRDFTVLRKIRQNLIKEVKKMTISEKSAYLKGLADGMKLDCEKAEGKLIKELIDLVAEIAGTVETVDNDVSELYDYVDEMDQDLADVEEIVFDIDEDEDDDEYELGEYDDDEYEDCDGECEGCHGCDDIDETEDVFDIEAEGLRCVICENCGDTVCFDESRDPREIECPGCGKPVVKDEE